MGTLVNIMPAMLKRVVCLLGKVCFKSNCISTDTSCVFWKTTKRTKMHPDITASKPDLDC